MTLRLYKSYRLVSVAGLDRVIWQMVVENRLLIHLSPIR